MFKTYNILLWELFVRRRTTKIDIIIDNVIYFFKNLYKEIKPKRRLYPFGSYFHFNYDSPTLKEKIDKWLCDKIFDKPRKMYRYKVSIFDITRPIVVKEFFDYSTGRYQDWGSRKYKEELAAKGKIIMSEEEAEQDAKKNRERIDRENIEKSDGAYFSELDRYMKTKNINPGDIFRQIERQGGFNG